MCLSEKMEVFCGIKKETILSYPYQAASKVMWRELYQLHFFIIIWFSVEAHIVCIKAEMKFFFCRRFGYFGLSFFLLV